MPIFLREHDVENLLTLPAALARVEEALRDFGMGNAQNRPRQRVRGSGVLHVMTASWTTRGYMGFKAYTALRGGTRFYFHLFDSNTGKYLAIMEADRLGQMRTGAASGVASKYLARDDAKILGLLGCGWQAESQLEAVCAVRPIERVFCFAREELHRNAFAEKMSARVGIPVQATTRAEEAVRDADIVTAITTASTPVLHGEWLKAGAHVNAVGVNWAQRREVDSDTLRRADAIFADSVEQAHWEAGDLLIPVMEGVIGWQQVQELGLLVAGRTQGRTREDAITFFKSQGIALEDVAVGSLVYERARAEGIGEPLPFSL